ncbi:MAG: clostripain-related cysteine peptidase [Candidatus Bathyarchaeia archaeon]
MKAISALALLLSLLAVVITAPSALAKSAKTTKWTFMVYMDADNNLDYWAYYSLDLMDNVGSTNGVNIVVLWDGYYQPAYMYKVVRGGLELVSNFPLNGEEINMGEPHTLKTFVGFVTKNFKAERYLLVLWNHGQHFLGCCLDEHPEDYLTHDEVVSGLAGYRIDILAYDACLEAMIEVAYEYNVQGLNINYLVASENYVPLYGYPYDEILGVLTTNPEVPTLNFAQTIVAKFAEFYKPRAHFNGGVMATLSVIDVSMVDEAVKELAYLTDVLKNNMEIYHDLISEARGEGNLPWSEYGWEYYIDLPSFVKCLMDRGPGEIISLARALLDTLQNDVIKAIGNTKPMDSAGACGVGIWFPPSETAKLTRELLPQYEKLSFASQGWLDFLHAYWNK